MLVTGHRTSFGPFRGPFLFEEGSVTGLSYMNMLTDLLICQLHEGGHNFIVEQNLSTSTETCPTF